MKKSFKIIISIIMLMAFISTSMGLTSIPVKSIKLNALNINIREGKSFQLKVIFTPENATNKKLVFSSANKGIATVSSKGYVKGVKAGKTVITVTTSNNVKAKCNVTITKAPRIKLVMWQSSWAKPQDDPGNKRVKAEIDKALNIDLHVVVAPPQNGTEKFNLMISSGEQIDVTLGWINIFKGYKDGIVARLNELIDAYGPAVKRNIPDDLLPMITEDDGSILAVPNLQLGDMTVFAVRNDLLKKYGMAVPKTLSEYEAYLEKAKNDGLVPVLYDTKSTTNTYRAFGGMYVDGGITWTNVQYDEKGNLVDMIRIPGFKNIISKMAEWVAKGYIPRDLISWTSNKTDEMFSAGKISSFVAWGSTGFTPYANYFKDHKDAYWVYLDPLTGPSGKNAGTQGTNYSGPVWILSTSKVKETAMRYLNWLLEDIENWMLATYGVKGVDWEWTDKNKAIIRTIDNKNPYGCSYYFFDYQGYNGHFVSTDNPGPRDILYNNFYEQYPIHSKFIQKNPLKYTDIGLFSEIDSQFKVADLTTYKKEEIAKFIYGEKNMSEWDSFVEKYLSIGGKEYDEARNKVWQQKKSKYIK